MLLLMIRRLASMLFGQYGENLALLERRLNVVAEQRGNHVTIQGQRAACIQAGVHSRYEGGALGEGEGEAAEARLAGVYVQAQAAFDALA